MQFAILIAVLAAGTAGLISLGFRRWEAISKLSGAAALGISGLTGILAGIKAIISKSAFLYQFSLGAPELTCNFKLDSLSGFFFAVIGIVVTATAIYTPGYMRCYEKQKSILGMTFFTGLFIAGMYLVLLASDVFSFMLAWELMSITSYFLVAYHHEQASNRLAAFVYLIMAQASGIFILFSFSILIKFSSGFAFSALQNANLTPAWSSLAFIFALIGFSMKAGVMPLHVWLPRAHPAAPSHISALMSGVMLKVAVYGLLRFCFGVLKNLHWQWGVLILIAGTASALLGVLYALMQHDLKKLLAYCSVENIGIIFIGIGLAIIFIGTHHPLLGALGLIAALYHCLNHALFKSLLFFGAGAILQHSREHDIEKMGGLIHKMPYTAIYFLIGCISISALPPLNGFVSEWLTFQTALQTTVLQSTILRALIPASAAMLALTGALASACFIKVYGIAFLGQARTRQVRHARDPNFGMLFAMGFLALLCLIFGILPSFTIDIIGTIPQHLFGVRLPATHSWLWLRPLSFNAASYSAPIVLLSLLAILLASFWLLILFYKRSQIKKTKPWECGFGAVNPRMQYSAAGFAMPIRRVFKGTWQVDEKIEKIDSKQTYSLSVTDWVWKYFYEPLEHYVLVVSRFVAKIQGGNIRVYLAYTFCTLLLLLVINY